MTDLVPLRYRGKYFGIMSAMWSIGSVSGPILGGGFAENVSWVRIPPHSLSPESKPVSIEMDFLHQLPVHCSRSCLCPSVPEPQYYP
jgi:hypothetical protein